jgi:hypothetical protein
MTAKSKKLLKLEVHHTEEEFNFSNSLGIITIKFSDGEFERVNYAFRDPYSRDQWKILAEINDEITRIEKEMKKNE